MAGPGPSKSLGDTYEGLPAGDDSSAAIGSSRVRVTARINASTSSTRARLYARPSGSSTDPSCITGAPSDDRGTVAVVPPSLSSAIAGYHTAPNVVAGSGSSASHTRLAIVASAMGLAPLNCSGLKSWRDTMDANSLIHTFLNRSVALVHRNASGRSSSAAPSGGSGLATRVNHHESSVGKRAAGLLPHIAEQVLDVTAVRPAQEIVGRRELIAPRSPRAARSCPRDTASAPSPPAAPRVATIAPDRPRRTVRGHLPPDGAPRDVRQPHVVHPRRHLHAQQHLRPVLVPRVVRLDRRTRRARIDAKLESPDASPVSRARANHGDTRTGHGGDRTHHHSPGAPRRTSGGGGRLDVRVDHRLHRGAGVSRASGFVPRVHDAHVSRGAAPEQEPCRPATPGMRLSRTPPRDRRETCRPGFRAATGR